MCEFFILISLFFRIVVLGGVYISMKMQVFMYGGDTRRPKMNFRCYSSGAHRAFDTASLTGLLQAEQVRMSSQGAPRLNLSVHVATSNFFTRVMDLTLRTQAFKANVLLTEPSLQSTVHLKVSRICLFLHRLGLSAAFRSHYSPLHLRTHFNNENIFFFLV